MALTARDPGGNSYVPPEEGVFQAVCYGIYDIGTQYSEKWNKSAHRVIIAWEIPDARIELERDGKTINLPRGVSKEYTLSLHQKAQLRKDLETWRGRTFTKEELAGFDLSNILKANCMIQILHVKSNEKTYANVAAIMPIMKSLKVLKPENEIKFFSFEDKNQEIPENTPKWIVDKIQTADEWTGDAQEDEDSATKPPSWMEYGAPMGEPPPDEDSIPF
jgi:hypothetical protein